MTMIGAMASTARKIPILTGWCNDDGADMIFYDINIPSYTMNEA